MSMIQTSFTDQERVCRAYYDKLGKCYHVCTPENHPIILKSREDYMAVMTILALCAKMFRGLVVLSFQWMSNHLHLVLSGDMTQFQSFFREMKRFLTRYLQTKYGDTNLKEFNPKVIEINDLENLRNVIVYVNRNGYVVSPGDTPFSYEWGANRFYFNPEAKKRYDEEKKMMTQTACQEISHSRKCDHLPGLFSVDGYISPMCFCEIELGERLFRDARHYFAKISKNIESQAEIAALAGERIFYTDEDLFSLIQSISKERHGVLSPGLLPVDVKIHVAKLMHHDYNASNKQIQRILKMDINTVNALFPLSAKR